MTKEMYTSTFDAYEPKKGGVSFVDIKGKGGKFIKGKMLIEVGRVLNLPNNLNHGDTITFVATPEMKVIEITHVNFMEVQND